MTLETLKSNDTLKTAIGYFLLILVGTLLSALLGGVFAALIAAVSPGFVNSLFSLKPEDGSPLAYAFSVGMIWGLFIGIGVSSFACLLTTVIKVLRLRIEKQANEK